MLVLSFQPKMMKLEACPSFPKILQVYIYDVYIWWSFWLLSFTSFPKHLSFSTSFSPLRLLQFPFPSFPLCIRVFLFPFLIVRTFFFGLPWCTCMLLCFCLWQSLNSLLCVSLIFEMLLIFLTGWNERNSPNWTLSPSFLFSLIPLSRFHLNYWPFLCN